MSGAIGSKIVNSRTFSIPDIDGDNVPEKFIEKEVEEWRQMSCRQVEAYMGDHVFQKLCRGGKKLEKVVSYSHRFFQTELELSSGKKVSETPINNGDGSFIEMGQKVSIKPIKEGWPVLKGTVLRVYKDSHYSVRPGRRGVIISISAEVELEDGSKMDVNVNYLTPIIHP